MKIIATMPLYKFMDAICVQSLIAMVMDIQEKGDSLKMCFTQGENVCLARNMMFKHCADISDLDYVITLDSDHDYSADAMYRIIEKIEKNDLPALSASYKVRGDKYYSMVRDGKNITKETLGDGVQDCDIFGFGFAVFKKDTIKKMVDKYKMPFEMDGTTYTGEDALFCQRMKDSGMRVCYDADITIGHLCTVWNR